MNSETDFLTFLNQELSNALKNQADYHGEMEKMLEFYKYSAFYPKKTGDRRDSTDTQENLLRVYADKNIHFTSKFPTIKVPTAGRTPQEREAASVREKILLATWRLSGGKALQRKWAFDGTIFSAAIAETCFDFQSRKVYVKRYDPRYCVWQMSDSNELRVEAFWAVFPISKQECIDLYGVAPTGNTIPMDGISSEYFKSIDGKEWFMQAIRWDASYRSVWVGNQIVEEPHKHGFDFIPVDICTPFYDGETNGRGGFYLRPMVNPQANLNLTLARRDSIVKRMAHPVLWGRGIVGRQFDEVKESIKSGGGGMVGLKQGGELGILQLSDTSLLDTHAAEYRAQMLRLSGFSAAAMGELAGANTSGDALGMYFTPTQRHIENQNIAWISFYESINAKILRAYEIFGLLDEQFTLEGVSPRSTIISLGEGDSAKYGKDLAGSNYSVKFTNAVINKKYTSVVEMPAVTPKNELEEKRLVVEAVAQKFMSRTTAFELYGIESPEDELNLLTQEQMNPALNPAGMAQMVAAATATNPKALPAGGK